MGHHGEELFAEGLAIGMILGRRRRRPPQPGAGKGCADACGCVVGALLLVAVVSTAVHLWYVTLPVAAAVAAIAVTRRRRRIGPRR